MNIDLFLQELTELSKRHGIGVFADCHSEDMKLFNIKTNEVIGERLSIDWNESQNKYNKTKSESYNSFDLGWQVD